MLLDAIIDDAVIGPERPIGRREPLLAEPTPPRFVRLNLTISLNGMSRTEATAALEALFDARRGLTWRGEATQARPGLDRRGKARHGMATQATSRHGSLRKDR